MTIRLNGKAMNVVLAFSLLLSAVLFFPTLRPASAQDEAGSRKAKSAERGKSAREKRQAKRENSRGLSKLKENSRNQQLPDSLGQKYALEFATTLLIYFDRNQDAHLTREEAAATQWPHAVNVWADADSNRDKRVSRQELKDSYFALFDRERKADGKPTHQFGEEAWKRPTQMAMVESTALKLAIRSGCRPSRSGSAATWTATTS